MHNKISQEGLKMSHAEALKLNKDASAKDEISTNHENKIMALETT